MKKACLLVGNQTRLAFLLGVKPPTVCQWATGIRPIPAERCIEIERATGSQVRCEDLRPDVDWAYLRGTSSDQAKEAA